MSLNLDNLLNKPKKKKSSNSKSKSKERVKEEKKDSNLQMNFDYSDIKSNNAHKGRIYPRASAQVKIRYSLVNRSLNDPNSLISDGIEYPTIAEDISAGGLKFISKV